MCGLVWLLGEEFCIFLVYLRLLFCSCHWDSVLAGRVCGLLWDCSWERLLGIVNKVIFPVYAMHKSVTVEVAFLGELLPALRTLISLFLTVNKHMRREVTLLSEPLTTLLTLIGLVLCVHKPVTV